MIGWNGPVKRRISAAMRLRRKVLRVPEVTDAWRVVHGEGDDLPGLVVDRIGRTFVCEHHALGFWNWREDVTWALKELMIRWVYNSSLKNVKFSIFSKK